MTAYVWQTRDGRRLKMADITDAHLQNIIRQLDGRYLDALEEGYRAISYLQGEYAIDAAENEIESECQRILHMKRTFESEAVNRGLPK
jgi:hypothetical protein